MNLRLSSCVLLPLLLMTGCYRVSMSGLSYEPQEGWVRQSTEGPARQAQYELPGPKGSEPATLAIFYFGPQGAGTVDANVERWMGQFQQPDGRESRQAAEQRSSSVNGLNLHSLDISGTYVAQTPGSDKKHNDPGFRMLACVVDCPAGPYYVRFLGPAATVEKGRPAYERFIASLRPEPLKPAPSKPAEHP